MANCARVNSNNDDDSNYTDTVYHERQQQQQQTQGKCQGLTTNGGVQKLSLVAALSVHRQGQAGRGRCDRRIALGHTNYHHRENSTRRQRHHNTPAMPTRQNTPCLRVKTRSGSGSGQPLLFPLLTNKQTNKNKHLRY